MSSESQADDIDRIEQALLRLRLGHGRGARGMGGGPPWGSGAPPWVRHGAGPRWTPGAPGEHTAVHGGRGSHGRGLGGGARLRLLEVLAAASAPPAISDLAEAIGVDQPRASRLVADGVARGFVTRQQDPADARRSNVAITAAGRAFLDSVRGARRSAVEDALAGFTPSDRATLATLLDRFSAAWPSDRAEN